MRAVARAGPSPGGMIRPDLWSSTTSGRAPTSVATTGIPCMSASMALMPWGSRKEGSARTEQRRSRRLTSGRGTRPRTSTLGIWTAGEQPAMMRRASGSFSRTLRNASTRRGPPFVSSRCRQRGWCGLNNRRCQEGRSGEGGWGRRQLWRHSRDRSRIPRRGNRG